MFDDGAGTLIKPLTWQGDVSLARSRDGQLTLQRVDDNPRWAGIPDLDEAGPLAVTAYFAAYGPAPLDNLHHWLGSGLSAGRKRLQTWLAELGDRLVPVDVDGTEAYVLREDVDPLLAARASEVVRLLPGHDQWVMGPGTKDERRHPARSPRPDDAQGQSGHLRWRRGRHMGTQGRRPDGHLALRRHAARRRDRGGGRAAGRVPGLKKPLNLADSYVSGRSR